MRSVFNHPCPLFIVFICCITTLAGSTQQTHPTKTGFSKETGEFGIMLKNLEDRMTNYQEKWVAVLGGKKRIMLVTGRARKYLRVTEDTFSTGANTKQYITKLLPNEPTCSDEIYAYSRS